MSDTADPNARKDPDSAPPIAGEKILSVEKAQRMAEFFSILGDPNRWRILSALALKEMRVRDLAEAVQMTESAVSHWTSGRNCPGPRARRTLCICYGIPEDAWKHLQKTPFVGTGS